MRRILPLLALALAIPVARADDVVDLQVGPRDRVRGTLRPGSDREKFLVAALRGSAVKATLRTEGESGLVPALDLVDDAEAQVAAGSATSNGTRISGLALSRTAPHWFRVSGDGDDGDYRLDLVVTPQRTWTGASAGDLGPGAETTFAFAAPAGAVAQIDLRAAPGSPYGARILDVTDSQGTVVAADPPAAVAPRHRASVVLGAAGEHVVRLRNDGAAAGGWTISVRLRYAASRRTTVDLRDASLTGEFDGTQSIVGRVAGGAEDVTIEGGLNLDGVSIAVPAGSLATPAVISMTESRPFFVSDSRFAAGTTVSFQPSGATFATAASVTVPIDVDAFDDPVNNPGEMTIVVEDPETGEQQTIAATSVDLVNGTATFPVSHFSRFQPTSPNPRPLRGAFADIELTGRTLPGYGAEVTLGRNGFGAAAKQGLGSFRLASAVRSVKRLTIAWSLDSESKPRFSVLDDQRSGIGGTVGATDDGAVEIRAGDASATLDRGRGGESLSSVEAIPERLRFHAMVRRARGAPTAANLAGAWHGSLLEVEARQLADGRIDVLIAGHEFDLAVGADGRAAVTGPALQTFVQRFPETPWRARRSVRAVAPGRLEVNAGEAVLRAPLGASTLLPAETRLGPVLRGDALVGGASVVTGPQGTPDGAAFRVVLLVRHAEGASGAGLPANSILSSFALRPQPGTSVPATLRFESTRGFLSTDDAGVARIAAFRRSLGHDGAGLATSDQGPLTAQGPAQVAADGSYSAAKGAQRGFVTPRDGTLVLFTPGAAGIGLGLALPARPASTK